MSLAIVNNFDSGFFQISFRFSGGRVVCNWMPDNVEIRRARLLHTLHDIPENRIVTKIGKGISNEHIDFIPASSSHRHQVITSNKMRFRIELALGEGFSFSTKAWNMYRMAKIWTLVIERNMIIP